MNTVLGLDSFGRAAGACLVRDGAVLAEEYLDTGLTHSQTLLPLVQRVFAAACLAPRDVNLWAVTGGPGSFTGLRIGMALAKGMAFLRDAAMAPVSTLRAVAAAAGLCGTIVSVLDARRGEVYWAAFCCRGGVHRLVPDGAAPAQALAGFVQNAAAPVFFVGDGAEICYTMYGSMPNVAAADVPRPLPVARAAAFLAAAAGAGRVLAASEAAPRYLRLSQAERERQQRPAPPSHPEGGPRHAQPHDSD